MPALTPAPSRTLCAAAAIAARSTSRRRVRTIELTSLRVVRLPLGEDP